MRRVFSILFALALVLAFSLVVTTPVAAATLYVPSGSYPTIQAAVNAANPAGGDTIMVAAGIYAEQLTISKSLNLIGAGAGTTTIHPTAGTLTGDVDGYKNIVTISGTGVNVEFTGFTVSGPGTATGGSINAGIRVIGSANANIHHNNIVNIRNEPLSGYQEVWGILVGRCYWTGSDRTGTATIAYNNITGYQKAGIEVGGPGSSATIKNNTITGVGQTDKIAPYGICISRTATATMEGNLIENNDYAGAYYAGQGIFTPFSASGNLIIKGNEIRNNCQGITIFGTGRNTLIEGNKIHDNIQYGVFLAGSSMVNVTNTTIRCNDILNNGTNRNPPYDAGILVLDTMVGTGNVAHFNNIVGNYRGVNVIQSPGNPNTPDTFDARFSWWGANSGPTHSSNPGGTGDDVTDNVDFDSWTGETETHTHTGTASFTPDAGNITALTSVPTPTTPPPPVALPYGMFSFTVTGLSSGQTVIITVELPGAVPVGTKWWKYQGGSWYPMDIGSDDGDNIITVTLRDQLLGYYGVTGDEDLIVGQITDPGGPGTGPVGWETYPISKVRVLLPWIALFAAVMAGASLLVLRRRRA
jgi:parallel beta-helix repeat protein